MSLALLGRESPRAATAGMSPWLTFVGVGEDGLDGLSHAACKALAQATLVVGGRRHLDLVGGGAGGTTMAWTSPIEDSFPAILARRPEPVCVLASGDPFLFGIGSVLARHVDVRETRCFPQPSAFSLAAARLGWAMQDCALVSLCGRPLETLLPALQSGTRAMVLSADASTPGRVAAFLKDRGYGASGLVVCEAMGGARERLRPTTARDFALAGIDALNTVAIEIEVDDPLRTPSLVPGRPDSLFEHDGQITKAHVRAIVLAKLAPRPGEVLWDIGSGSGSVAIEWRLAHPRNRACAVERHASRAARLRRNAASFGVPDIAVVEGAAPEACAGLPRPDAVFIGGGATAPGVLERCAQALRSGGRLVVDAVTLETQALLIDRFRDDGGDLSTIAISHADPIGGFHGWRPAMPVTQWSWVKP